MLFAPDLPIYKIYKQPNKPYYNMRKHLLFFALVLLIASCGKDEEVTNPNNGDTVDLTKLNNGVTTCEYAPYTTGSSFTYEQDNGFGPETAIWQVGEEELIDGTMYVSINGFLGSTSSGFFNCENGEYHSYLETAPTVIGSLELVYLKETLSVGQSWDQTINQSANGINYTTRYNFTYASHDTERVVNNETYTDIIHVQLNTFSDFGFGSGETLLSTDDYYWAKGVGLIEVDGISVNMKLMGYQIN